MALAPRLSRAAANLVGAAPGRWIVDPFLGTGALLAEAALLGAHVAGVDRDPGMVRGSLANFAFLGAVADSMTVADGGVPFDPPGGGQWDGVLTDPPYGRASATGGESSEPLMRRVLSAWAPRVKPGGRLVLVAPDDTAREIEGGWALEWAIPDRVHRSLTREFRRYRRTAEPTS